MYLLDSGVEMRHTELKTVVAGTTFINDGRGVADCKGHGTAAASVIAGATLGVARAAVVIAVRILDCNGVGTVSGTLAGLKYVLDSVNAAKAANGGTAPKRTVVNLSIGTGGWGCLCL